MKSFFVEHALANVWCNPNQDNQLILKAVRISQSGGEYNRMRMMNRMLDLPTQGVKYFVYQIGQITPSLIGFLGLPVDWAIEKWNKFTDVCRTNNILIQPYNADGVTLPRFNGYYMFTAEKNLIFALQECCSIPVDYDSEPIYLRLYSNAYFRRKVIANQEFIYGNGKYITKTQDALDLQAECSTYKSKVGYVFCYVNGLQVDNLSLLTMKVGDVAEFIYDSTVERLVDFTVSALPVFNSIKDGRYKYLLHHVLQYFNDTIRFHDDIDFVICSPRTDGSFQGLYYHRNSVDAIRMVTHRDYSMMVDYFTLIATRLKALSNTGVTDLRKFKIRMIMRESGYYRALQYDNNRILEMYKIAPANVPSLMVGVGATVPEWRAENLENSAYTKVMSSFSSEVTLDLVQQAYGYNAMSKLLADTPVKVPATGSKEVSVPPGLQVRATAYEYDTTGKFIEKYPISNLFKLVPRYGNAGYVEMIYGEAQRTSALSEGSDNLYCPADENYRVYMCFLVNGAPNNEWRDITGSQYYKVVNERLVWQDLQYGQWLMVRTDQFFLVDTRYITLTNGNVFLTMTETVYRDNQFKEIPMPFPMGELDVWINGYSGVEGIDYMVDFPRIYILSKRYLKYPLQTSEQRIDWRFTGFCDSNLQRRGQGDVGFIEHGMLSNNNRFNIRDDKVLRITVGGKLKHRSELIFAEGTTGVSVTNANNGLPYQVRDIIVPLKGITGETTYTLRAKSEAIDTRIADYMTVKYPQPPRSAKSAIPQMYVIVSPFMARITDAVTTGELSVDQLTAANDDTSVLALCRTFESLLKVDLASADNQYDRDYVEVYPHLLDPINLSLLQYRFISRVIALYFQDKINMTNFYTYS